MKTIRSLSLIVTLLVSVLACNFTSQAPAPAAATQVPAQTPEPTQSPATANPPPAQPPAVDGKAVTLGGVSFVLPAAVASEISSRSTTELELPFINGPADLPQHTVISLSDVRVQNSRIEPKIIVFRASDYAQYNERIAQANQALQAPYSDGQPLPEPLACSLCAQIHGLKFQNGHGIRLLEQVNTGPAPINNEQLFYFFRGLTDDGQYYVQVELPVQIGLLPASSNPNAPLPGGGVAFDPINSDAYVAAVGQKLNAAAPGDFTPTLQQLDALIESLSVTGL